MKISFLYFLYEVGVTIRHKVDNCSINKTRRLIKKHWIQASDISELFFNFVFMYFLSFI